jgi:hypothetical protein
MMGRRKHFVACKLCYLLRVYKKYVFVVVFVFLCIQFFRVRPKKILCEIGESRQRRMGRSVEDKNRHINIFFYNCFSLKIGLASNLLDIVHKNFAERSTEEQVLERQRVSVDFCQEKRCLFFYKKQVMRLSIEPSRAGENFRKAIEIFLGRLGRSKF